ncbi:uncharacterized protein HaLaN_21070 [Haematococcus lacustris]|uniref:Exostosin GT47 domain-containing protein n=1 Tax=Haematococcus lacustris TaxID=44745 RepID=A0A699ZXL2_HAELA|nr:uncharacterized protein HaLaN_21070 [Haematococcus lacustris]
MGEAPPPLPRTEKTLLASLCCGCALGSTSGRWCEQTILSYCPNQCNLRGTCIEGWCKCDKDWTFDPEEADFFFAPVYLTCYLWPVHGWTDGPCYMPTSIYQNASFLLHWGRMDPEHTSGKDLVIPAFKHYHHFHTSNLLGVPPVNRDILLSFKLAQEDGWRKKYNIVIGSRDNYPADYSMMLSRSVFCLVVPGDGYATRAEDAILHGCLPLVIMDNVHAVYETILDWSKFSIRVPQARMAELPQILQAVNQTTILQMQRELAKVQHRFAYTTGPLQRHGLRLRYRDTQHIRDSELPHLPKGHPFVPLSRFPLRNDAFHTIMQWLYGRIKETR